MFYGFQCIIKTLGGFRVYAFKSLGFKVQGVGPGSLELYVGFYLGFWSFTAETAECAAFLFHVM